MNNRSLITLNFHKALNTGLKNRFGKIPSSTEFANQFNLRAYGTKTISRETARKWKTGIAFPEPSNLQVLIEWLHLSTEDIFAYSQIISHDFHPNSPIKKETYSTVQSVNTAYVLLKIQHLAQAALKHLTPRTAVLDETGKIILVNDAWRLYASKNATSNLTNTCEGINYLDVCKDAVGIDEYYATKMLVGIKAVMHDEVLEFTLKYPCHTGIRKKWFMARVTTFSDDGYKLTVIIHEAITESRFLEC
jgi:hypothetical protein